MSAFVDGILSSLAETLDPQILGAGFARFLTGLIVGSLVFLAFYLLWRVLDPFVRAVLRRTHMDQTTARFVEAVLKGGVLTLGAVQALAAVGVNMGAIIASLGIAGLTIGFAARDALSNVISGVLIFWDRPFVIGDLVEVGPSYGRVDGITLRSTRIVTPDGRMLAVPNTEIINRTVASYTNFPNLRLDVEVQVGVNEDLARVRQLMLDVVRADPAFISEPPPAMVVTALGDYNVTVTLQAWIGDERAHVGKRGELREKVYETLRAANVDMPYETVQLMPMDVRMAQATG